MFFPRTSIQLITFDFKCIFIDFFVVASLNMFQFDIDTIENIPQAVSTFYSDTIESSSGGGSNTSSRRRTTDYIEGCLGRIDSGKLFLFRTIPHLSTIAFRSYFRYTNRQIRIKHQHNRRMARPFNVNRRQKSNRVFRGKNACRFATNLAISIRNFYELGIFSNVVEFFFVFRFVFDISRTLKCIKMNL